MIDKLELFMILARERHFGRAAAACNISQPTLSSAIKQLEGQLGVPLVNRGARYEGLTPEGERVLDWARRIVGDCRAMTEEMKAARNGISGRIRLAVIPTALAALPEWTTGFSRQHPAVGFSVLSRTSAEILHMIAHLEADIGITYLENEPLGDVTAIPLYEERYCFVTADPDLFPGRDSVTWAEAGAMPLCLLTPDMQNRRIVNRYLEMAGVEARAVLETDSVIAMISHIAAGPWSGILPERLIAMVPSRDAIRSIPLIGPDGVQIVGVVAPRQELRPPAIAAFLRHVGLRQRDA
ncbi:LysR family transcriptional regulator [Zhengella mangrovi]|uniref:LysR family transcriptional regulator n=1 Tax=Zhengella mangrovi TaxID=1982044 RepID=A0A2G1QVB8_9HYPH|nr:LysR family transcriptional regulator [Zhengella mangrovi]PHP69148.1 LysR family transcriptional regulator [Zhengella mangrovi]